MNIKTVKDRQSLYDVEFATESKQDFGAFFLRYGDRIYKIDVERKLIKIKQYIFMRIRDLASSRRFKRFR
jgi:hypothetical protein